MHRRVRGPCSSEVFLMRLGYLGPLCYIACEYPCPHDIIEGPSESTESSLDLLYCIDHLSVCIAFPDYLAIPIRRGGPRHRNHVAVSYRTTVTHNVLPGCFCGDTFPLLSHECSPAERGYDGFEARPATGGLKGRSLQMHGYDRKIVGAHVDCQIL